MRSKVLSKIIFAFNNYVEKFASKCLIEPRNPPLLILQRIENKIVFGRHFYGKSLKCLICIKFVYLWITSIITAVAKTNYYINSLGFQILHLKNENTKTVDANSLLQDVETDLDQSFRDKVFEKWFINKRKQFY